ncbi:MAG TPA: M48 family metallopeptidase [Deltaproteobacteria bacterium]|nr:M48 family metallopeptidase [Deltaproteobacteria bacterium]
MIRIIWDGHYLDGKTAEKKPASIELTSDSLKIRVPGGGYRVWPYREIRQVQGFYGGEPVRLERGDAAPEILIIDDPEILSSLHEFSPEAAGRFHNPAFRPLRRRMTIYAAIGIVCAGLGIYFWGIPLMAELAAPLVPMEWEKRLGRSTLSVLAPEEMQCTDPKLDDAVRRITEILAAREPQSYPFRVYVVKSPMINALALPGGNIIIFSGLLEKTGSPEELAGVIAHEIQHITKRHALKRIIKDSSTGLMISAVTGDVTGAMVYGAKIAHMLAQLRYSRQDEEEADREGMHMLISAGIDPNGMIGFFETMQEQETMPGILQYVATHPDTGRRILQLKQLASAAEKAGGEYRSLPGKHDWDRLRKSCAGEMTGPRVRPD